MRGGVEAFACVITSALTGASFLKVVPVQKKLGRDGVCLGVHLRAPLADVVVHRDLVRLALVDRRLLLHVLVRDVCSGS